MTSKLPKVTLSLKQFLLRQEVLKLYREIFRTLKSVPDGNTQLELKEWARSDFRNNKHHTDETIIKNLIQHGKKSLIDLQKDHFITTKCNWAPPDFNKRFRNYSNSLPETTNNKTVFIAELVYCA